jgi:PqqD family protein of HPr-rel-A system
MWQLNPKSTLHYRHWGNEWAVFDVGSGHTHEMDTISAVALMCCENGWIELTQIVAAVMTDLELPSDSSLFPLLKNFLTQLTSLGVLENRAE